MRKFLVYYEGENYRIETCISQEDIEDFLRSRTFQDIGYAPLMRGSNSNLCRELFSHIAKEEKRNEDLSD